MGISSVVRLVISHPKTRSVFSFFSILLYSCSSFIGLLFIAGFVLPGGLTIRLLPSLYFVFCFCFVRFSSLSRHNRHIFQGRKIGRWTLDDMLTTFGRETRFNVETTHANGDC